jgi:hypothetical protein
VPYKAVSSRPHMFSGRPGLGRLAWDTGASAGVNITATYPTEADNLTAIPLPLNPSGDLAGVNSSRTNGSDTILRRWIGSRANIDKRVL